MTHTKNLSKGEVRIIGGKWRSRKLKFPAINGLRPTPDRVRETLFNWLAPYIAGANCLDLFAGSGALGLEALSRGASHVIFADQSREIEIYLREQLTLLEANNASVYRYTFHVTQNPFSEKKPFDLVFLDPPFHQGYVQKCCQWLEQENLLAADAFVYIEAESELSPLPFPNSWQVIRTKTAGKVGYHLLQKTTYNPI